MFGPLLAKDPPMLNTIKPDLSLGAALFEALNRVLLQARPIDAPQADRQSAMACSSSPLAYRALPRV